MAHIEFFADAFQYTHRGLLGAIAPPHKWIVHPMLFRSTGGGPPGGGIDLGEYAQFLGLPANAVLPEIRAGRRLKRQTMVNDVEPYRGNYLFLDPDTGIDYRGQGDTKHVTAMQLAEIARARQGNVVLVFDHSYDRKKGAPQGQVAEKLAALWGQHRLYGAAIIVRESPLVCYVWASTMHNPVDVVMANVRQTLPIPDRLVVY